MAVGDDLPLLTKLVDLGHVILTPPQDYDDSYSIDYARRHNACIVTNDRYNDSIFIFFVSYCTFFHSSRHR